MLKNDGIEENLRNNLIFHQSFCSIAGVLGFFCGTLLYDNLHFPCPVRSVWIGEKLNGLFVQ